MFFLFFFTTSSCVCNPDMLPGHVLKHSRSSLHAAKSKEQRLAKGVW